MTKVPDARPFHWGRMATEALGAAAAVLLAASIIVAAWRPSPGIGLGIVTAGVFGAIAALGVVASRHTKRIGVSPGPQPPVTPPSTK